MQKAGSGYKPSVCDSYISVAWGRGAVGLIRGDNGVKKCRYACCWATCSSPWQAGNPPVLIQHFTTLLYTSASTREPTATPWTSRQNKLKRCFPVLAFWLAIGPIMAIIVVVTTIAAHPTTEFVRPCVMPQAACMPMQQPTTCAPRRQHAYVPCFWIAKPHCGRGPQATQAQT
jgi:hypothetical protein